MTRDILEMIKDLGLNINRDEARLIEDKISEEEDFYVEIDGCEFRFISEQEIFGIYVDSIEQMVQECYLGGSEIPNWVEIDWDQTAENLLESDGYGHHFASYDGNEYQYTLGGYDYYLFRTN
jgi:hypothetical protein